MTSVLDLAIRRTIGGAVVLTSGAGAPDFAAVAVVAREVALPIDRCSAGAIATHIHAAPVAGFGLWGGSEEGHGGDGEGNYRFFHDVISFRTHFLTSEDGVYSRKEIIFFRAHVISWMRVSLCLTF